VSLKSPSSPADVAGVKEIEITAPQTVGDLATRLRISPADVQRDL
jgi:hypothetical protein